jgi:hypothetical protein
MKVRIPTVMLLSLIQSTRYVDLELERIGFQLFNHITTPSTIGRPFHWSAYSLCVAEFNRVDL